MADIGIFDLCAFCPSLCMDRCPVVAATGSNTWTPQSKMMTGWLMVNGHRQMDALNAATIYQCTGCMSCHDVCLHEIDVEQALFGLRRKVVEAGACPWPSARFVDNGQDLQQPLGDDADRWIDLSLEVSLLKRKTSQPKGK